MSREIKFRAWDKNTNTMIYSDVHKLYSWGIATNGNLVDMFEDEELMQYTGLKDKNGKEIYEGDIIYFWANKTQCIASLDHLQFIKCFAIEDDHIVNVLPSEYMEVIGNIYENPELLCAN